MRVTREKMAENRRRILDAAGRLFKAEGVENVSVAQVMKAAGLTHGGFYGHFASKDDLLARTLEHAQARVLEASAGSSLREHLAAYLSPRHRDDAAGGCPTAGLAAEIRHHAPASRAAIADGFRAQLDRLTEAYPGPDEAAKRRAAVGSWAAMIGAVILARAVDDRELSDEILAETHAWLDAGLSEAASGLPPDPAGSTAAAPRSPKERRDG